MQKTKEELIATISKLVLKADSVAGTSEEEAFRVKAAKLMAKHMIHETELDLDTDSFVLDTFECYKDGNQVPQWAGMMVMAICSTFDCRTVYRQYSEFNEYDVIGTFPHRGNGDVFH